MLAVLHMEYKYGNQIFHMEIKESFNFIDAKNILLKIFILQLQIS